VLPDTIKKLVAARHQAKANQDWARADVIRAEIAEAGYEVLDTKDGVKVKKL
jgi:cysteinyl-tRNA synthetase